MKTILLLTLVFASATNLSAQQTPAPQQQTTPAPDPEWHLLLEPYMMFGNLNGNVAIGTQPVSNINEDPSDLFKHLNFGAMLYTEAYSNKWIISSDFIYMKLGSDIPPNDYISNGHATIKQLNWELAAMKRLTPWFSLGLAAQLNSIKMDLSIIAGGNQTNGNLTKAWVDPSIVSAIKLPLGGKWTLRARGNIGGFGVASDIYWQLQAYADYRFSKLFQTSIGYRAIKDDYETGSGDNYYLYNVITFGPVIRFGFNF